MHISRTAIVMTHRKWLLWERAPERGGVRLALTAAAAIVLGLALTLWLVGMQLGPGAPCLHDPGAVCEPF